MKARVSRVADRAGFIPSEYVNQSTQRNGFHVRKVVWGLLMARAERRDDEQIRACTIIVESEWKPRHRKPIIGSHAAHHEAQGRSGP